MIAVDTNVIVRYLTGDDPEQALAARALVDANEVFVSATVLLETEWVIRTVYGFEAGQTVKALRAFAGLANVTLENAAMAAQAFGWADRGLDFADALHLARAGDCTAFATFDRKLVRHGKTLTDFDVRVP